MSEKNARTVLQEQSLELMDNILHLGVVERLGWAGDTAAYRHDPLKIILRELTRPECQNQMIGRPELFSIYQEILEDPCVHYNWTRFAREAQACLMNLIADRLAICSALECAEDEETYVDMACKALNRKRELMSKGI